MQRTPIFFNVLTGSIQGALTTYSDKDYESGKFPNFTRSPRWYNKESNPSFFDPYILISCPHNRGKEDIRTPLNIGDGIVFVDSGGFQLSTGVVDPKKFTREVALKWSETNGDLFPILDYPVYGKANNFDDALSFSVESAKYYADNRTKDDCIIMNVLQANRSANMDRWYNGIKGVPLDGWAYGGHSNFIKVILQAMLFLKKKGEFDQGKCTNMHIFGTSSVNVIPYIIYAQHLFNKHGVNCLLSFDSSSASTFANYGAFVRFCNPTAISHTSISNRFDWSKLDQFSNMGCNCPICRDVNDINFLFSKEGKWQFYMIVAMHNFYQILKYKRVLEGIVSLDCKEVLDSLPKTMKANFATMREAFAASEDAGINIIQNKFITKIRSNPIDTSSSTRGMLNLIED